MLYRLCFYLFVRESIRQLTVNCWNTVFMLEFRRHCRYEPHVTVILEFCIHQGLLLLLLFGLYTNVSCSLGIHHPLLKCFPTGTSQWYQDPFRRACRHVQEGFEHLQESCHAWDYGPENMVKKLKIKIRCCYRHTVIYTCCFVHILTCLS